MGWTNDPPDGPKKNQAARRIPQIEMPLDIGETEIVTQVPAHGHADHQRPVEQARGQVPDRRFR